MSQASETHRISIINEEGEDPYVTPKTLEVKREDQLKFVVVAEEGQTDKFNVCPETDVFSVVDAGVDISVEQGVPKLCSISSVASRTIHRYTVSSKQTGTVDPILVVYE